MPIYAGIKHFLRKYISYFQVFGTTKKLDQIKIMFPEEHSQEIIYLKINRNISKFLKWPKYHKNFQKYYRNFQNDQNIIETIKMEKKKKITLVSP